MEPVHAFCESLSEDCVERFPCVHNGFFLCRAHRGVVARFTLRSQPSIHVQIPSNALNLHHIIYQLSAEHEPRGVKAPLLPPLRRRPSQRPSTRT